MLTHALVSEWAIENEWHNQQWSIDCNKWKFLNKAPSIHAGFEMFNEIFHKIFGNVINFKQIVQMYIMYVSYKTNSFYPMAIWHLRAIHGVGLSVYYFLFHFGIFFVEI